MDFARGADAPGDPSVHQVEIGKNGARVNAEIGRARQRG
jgi:hypothetical protein